MSVQRNTIANLAGQVYTTLIGIVMLPFYLEFLGAEAYGLVGFFALLQSWLMLLTAGVAPTLTREVGLYRGRGELQARSFREVLRSFELIVLAVALATGVAVWAGSGWLAERWLTVHELSVAEVAYCIGIMGLIVGLRWGTALYSSGLSGLERQVWLSSFNVACVTLRFGGAYILLRWVTREPAHYFEFQLAVSVLELLVAAWKFYLSQPAGAGASDPGLRISWAAVQSVLPFAMGIGYTTLLWVFVTQSDKLILSHVLPLKEYGYFALVAVIAEGVSRLSDPLEQAVLPRLTLLHSQGDEAAMLLLYRKTTQYLAVIVFSVGGMLALHPEPLLYGLTGNRAAAEWGAPVLFWLALGNAVLVVAGMQYTLQFVHGRMRMHVINATISAAIQVPVLAFVAYRFGAIPVAATWFAIRAVTFFIWPPIVHRKFAPGLHLKWLASDVLPPLVGAAAGLAVVSLSWVHPSGLLASDSRLEVLATLLVLGAVVLCASALAAGAVRTNVLQLARRLTPALQPSIK